MEKVLQTNIRNARKLLHNKVFSPIDLINACLERVKETKHLNAFITVTAKQALHQADKATERYKTAQDTNELDGIPIAIKDNFCTSNIKTTCAANILENFTPTYDATAYKRLQNAGAILIGKTNLDQFAMGSGTIDSIYGSTRNSWGYKNENNFCIAGGSSGGSAVAVATGTCFGALGSDTGGSTRNPASYCGIVGLKPTYGLVSRLGLIPLVNSMDVPGVLARYVDDAVLILNAIAGYDPGDSTTLTKPYKKVRLPPGDKLTVKGLKIGIPMEYACEKLNFEVQETWNEVARLLESAGATIKQVSLPHTEFSIVCYSILNQCEVASNMARYDGIEYGHRSEENASTELLFSRTRSKGFNEVVRNRILTGNYFLLARNYDKYFNQALKVRRLIADDFYKVWEDVQVLLTPTTLSTAPNYDEFVKKTNR